MPRGVYDRKKKKSRSLNKRSAVVTTTVNEPQSPTLHFFHEEGMSRYRVWNPTWFHDQFEIMTPAEFRELSSTCRRFGIKLEEQFDND